MPRVIHFEIPMDDAERAVKFYSRVFGWRIEKWAGPIDYWLATTGDASKSGIDGALAQRDQSMGASNTIDVPSVDKSVEKIVAAGGTVVAAKMTVPGVGYAAYCRDTESNLYALDADNGRQLWGFKTGGGIFSTSVAADGMLYVGAQDGILYALQ